MLGRDQEETEVGAGAGAYLSVRAGEAIISLPDIKGILAGVTGILLLAVWSLEGVDGCLEVVAD